MLGSRNAQCAVHPIVWAALRPGGAAKLGLIERDHPLIAALPPQGGEG